MSMEATTRKPVDPVDASIGERMRALRHQRDLSLQQVAAQAELSVGYLSQIERGLSSPAVRDLMRIAAALETDPSFFFPAVERQRDEEGRVVVRLAERREVAFHAGVTKQLLTPEGDSHVRVYLITIEPGGRAGEALYAHAGEEAGLVLQGRLQLFVESHEMLLNEGDSFRFDSSRPHRFANASPMVTRVVWVNAAPPEPGH